jgi:hypothetical protein
MHSAGNMAFRTYRGAALFCAVLRKSAQKQTSGALIVRKCDCAEMHMIPIAYQCQIVCIQTISASQAGSADCLRANSYD